MAEKKQTDKVKIDDKIDRSEYDRLKSHVFFFKNAKEIVIFDPVSRETKSLPSEKKLKLWISKNFKIVLPGFEEDYDKIIEHVLLRLTIENQFTVLSYERDPFATEARIMRDDHKLHYIAPGFYMKPFIKKFEIPREEAQAILDDYRDHFPQFDEFLKWLIAVRFTTNRRTSYTYMRIPAGFGKSFLASLFEDLGVGRKINQNQLKPNSAGDLSPADFRNAFILMIDEFTHFAQELKDITHGMYLSPKYQLSEYVPLYAKVFMSAEKSTSFFGDAGVDAQLAERVAIIDLGNAGRLEDRPLYKENTLKYAYVLKLYIHHFFKKEAKKYVEMGELAANKAANDVLDAHHRRYRVEADTIEKIREKCIETLREFMAWHEDIDSYGNRPRNTVFERLENEVVVKNEDEIIAKNPVKMYEIIISEAGEQFRKTARFKQTALDEIFKVPMDRKPQRHAGKVFRGVLINLAKLEKLPKKIPFAIEAPDGKVELKGEVLVDAETGQELF